MENNEQEFIERYFCNELTAEERAVFERQQATDDAFRREVEDFEKAIRYVRLDGRRALQSKLAERGRQLDAEKKSGFSHFRRWWVVAVLVVAGLGWWLFDKKDDALLPVAPDGSSRLDSMEIKAPAPPDSSEQTPSPNQLPSDKKSDAPPVAAQQSNAAQLFAVYFQPYKDESLEPSVRGEGDATPEEIFLQLYWDGKHREAISAFEKLEPASKNKGDLQFLQANSLLAMGRAKEAVTVLENLGRTRFSAEAKWLLALAFLKNGEREKAVAQLREIAGEAASSRRGDAQRLLAALK